MKTKILTKETHLKPQDSFQFKQSKPKEAIFSNFRLRLEEENGRWVDWHRSKGSLL